MFQDLKRLYAQYPSQYWLMVSGVFLSTAGASMIMPFMMIYATARLRVSMTTAGTLLTIQAGTGLFSSFIAGSLADRIGRKFVMNISLSVNGLVYFFMMQAETYSQFALLMFLIGLSNPLYQVGADAMLADLIPSGKRADAYAIHRTINNAAFAIGPAVGGFLASRSYDLVFHGAAGGMLLYSALLFLFAHETLRQPLAQSPRAANRARGYEVVLHDRGYLAFVFTAAFGLIAPSMLWMLLSVYAKSNYGLSERLYGWLPTTNALMCVFMQYAVTRHTRRYRHLPVIAVGMAVYALGVGSVAFMSSFWGFWLSMVILTVGELILVPTASTYVANRAPADVRGRYMSVYWLSWGLARALAPLLGGFLNDRLSPRSIWYGGLFIGLLSALGLFLFARAQSAETQSREAPWVT